MSSSLLSSERAYFQMTSVEREFLREFEEEVTARMLIKTMLYLFSSTFLIENDIIHSLGSARSIWK